LKSSDLAAFVLLFLIGVAAVFYVGYLWIETIGWEQLWLLGIVLLGVAVVEGILFARYALHPLAKQSNELERLLKDTLHELNIPVATIKANLSMLQKSLSDPKALKRLKRIERASDQLLELYKEVDYTIQKNIDRIQKERFDAAQVIAQRLEMLEDMLKSKEVKVELEPLWIEASKQGFVKVIDNLLSNALKYTPEGGLIKVIAKEGTIVVEDNGIGIDEKDLVRIFERYYRATEQEEGKGIGLDIVKSVCDKEGIGIRIHSKKNEGTTVVLDCSKVAV